MMSLDIKYSKKNADNLLILGKIFRIFNKQNNKSYISYTTNNNSDFLLCNIIKDLNMNIFENKSMQLDWNKDKINFEAEDLQVYYTKSELFILIINWQKYFGGKNYELLYNINSFDENEYKDIDAILDTNKYYTYYINQLLQINRKYKEQIDILNQNYINLQLYNNLSNVNLASINKIIRDQVSKSPIQILQMLTSLLFITSAECNKQFNNIQTKQNINSIILNNQSLNINNENKSIQFDEHQIESEDNESIQFNKIEPIKLDKNQIEPDKKQMQFNKNKSNNNELIKSDENELAKLNENKAKFNENQYDKISYDKITAAIQIVQQSFTILKHSLKKIRINQHIKKDDIDTISSDLHAIQNLFNIINEQLIICRNNINNIQDPVHFNNTISKFNKQLQNLQNEFNILNTNITERINQLNSQKNIKTENLSTEELIELKLQKSDTLIQSNENNFKFFDGSQSINNWLHEVYHWLVNNDFEQFAQELQYEVNKSIINRSPTKSLIYLIKRANGKNYDEIAKQFNTSKTVIIRNIDSLQESYPAIYLAFGYKSKTAQGKDKRVINALLRKGITKIPDNF